jgi:hypothetical protein
LRSVDLDVLTAVGKTFQVVSSPLPFDLLESWVWREIAN